MQVKTEPLLTVRSPLAVRYAATFLWPTISWVLLAWAFAVAAQMWTGSETLVAMSWGASAVAFVLAYGMARPLMTSEVPVSFCAGLAKLEAELERAAQRFRREEAEAALDMVEWPDGTRVEASNGWWQDSDGGLQRILFVRGADDAPDAPTRRVEFIVRFDAGGHLDAYEIRGLPDGQ